MKHLLAAAAILLVPTTAFAWVGTQTCYPTGIYKCQAGETPIQVRWKYRCVGYEINELGTNTLPQNPDGTIDDTVIDVINTSFETWNANDCSDLTFVYVGTTATDKTEYDRDKGCTGNQNVIVFRDDTWPYAGASAFALTSVTFSPENGLISDADIELNTATHEFTIGDQDVMIDLQNTLTHEAGHFLGLDHAPARDTTMFFSAAEGETKKRDLADDDIAGLCSIYPVVESDRVCANPPPCNSPNSGEADDGCCAIVATDRPLPKFLWVLAGLFMAYGVRRRASSQN